MSEENTAEQNGTETTEDKSSQPTIEETAKAQGWDADYDGADKIDAAEFVRRKPLFEKIKAQSRELKEVKKLVEGMATTYKTTAAAQYQRGIADAEQRMKQAKADFDVEAFEKASIDKGLLEKAQATVTVESEPPEVTDFCERNPWFEKNAIMRTDALEYGEKFIKRNPSAPVAEKLEYIETKMKQDYPDAFAEKPARKPSVSAVEGATPSSSADPFSKLKASMSGEEKRIMGMFIKGSGMTEKEYLESYSTVRER